MCSLVVLSVHRSHTSSKLTLSFTTTGTPLLPSQDEQLDESSFYAFQMSMLVLTVGSVVYVVRSKQRIQRQHAARVLH